MANQKTTESLPGKHKDIPILEILEYKAAGLKNTEIAKLVGCSKQNVSDRLKAWKGDFKGLETYKNKRADILALFQKKLLFSLTDKDIKGMPGGSRVLAMCQLYDKEQVERGKPTQIVGYQDIQGQLLTVDQELAALEAELAELEGKAPEIPVKTD
jgi:DNA-binding Lrp family transcriptional regulator